MSNALIVHLGSIDLNMIPMPTWYYSSSYEWHKVITNQLSYWACPWPLICMLLIVSVYSGLREKETLHAAWPSWSRPIHAHTCPPSDFTALTSTWKGSWGGIMAEDETQEFIVQWFGAPWQDHMLGIPEPSWCILCLNKRWKEKE